MHCTLKKRGGRVGRDQEGRKGERERGGGRGWKGRERGGNDRKRGRESGRGGEGMVRKREREKGSGCKLYKHH